MSRPSRFFSILDGASLTDEDEAGNPSYYGYTRPGGSWVILRYNSSTGKYDYKLGVDSDLSLATYDTAWTNRATIGYQRAGTIKKL